MTNTTTEDVRDKEQSENNQAHVKASSLLNRLDALLLFVSFVTLIWPWIFFGAVYAKKGIQMSNHVAKVAQDDPHVTTYFVTFICNINAMVVTCCFSFVFFQFIIIRFVNNTVPSMPSSLSDILSITLDLWNWRDNLKSAMDGLERELNSLLLSLVIFVTIGVIAFPHLVSSTTSLITPIPFNRRASLSGTELDFSSRNSTCLNWFRANPKFDACDWQLYKGRLYRTCFGKNQMVDILEAGHGNILELVSNNSRSLTFSQLGADDGPHFVGSIRGVLPIGPNGLSAFNTLKSSPLSNPRIMAGVSSYDYTLDHQGLDFNVSCSYQPTSPIQYVTSSPSVLEHVTSSPNASSPSASSPSVLQYNVSSCAGLGATSISTNVSYSVLGANTLMYWPCQSAPNNTEAPSYSLYLRGFQGSYEVNIGNMTCTVSSIQPAIFPVVYRSTKRSFSSGSPLPANESATFSSSVINYALIGLGAVIAEGQNFDSNLLAESVVTFGVKSFGLPPYARSDEYLRLYEHMIQGILEYETTYIRLIYSTVPDPPPSCIRTVTGSTNYEVFGWFVTTANIGLLIPLTLINVSAVVLLLMAMRQNKDKLDEVVNTLQGLYHEVKVEEPKYP